MSPVVPNLREALTRPLLFRPRQTFRLIGDGPDLIGLLQRLGTGDLLPVADGEGRVTVLTTAKGRIVQRLFVHPLGATGVLLTGGRSAETSLLDHIRKYTFAERTGLRDATTDWEAFGLCGPDTERVLEACGAPVPLPGGQAEGKIADVAVWVLGHDGEDATGRTVLVAGGDADSPARVEAALARALESCGGFEADEEWVDLVRILRGVPVSGAELNDEANPLEAGLWDAVSFSKGCYVGQEVVARLNTYDKVSRTLVGVECPDLRDTDRLPSPGDGLYAGGRVVGRLTRFRRIPAGDRGVGLAFVKKRQAAAGDAVRVGAADGTAGILVELPFPQP